MKLYYKVKHLYDPSEDVCFEHLEGESQTVPGDAMSIKDIMARAMNGIEPDRKEVMYLDSDLDSIDRYFGQSLDLTDVDELSDRIEILSDRIKAAQSESESEPELEPEPEPVASDVESKVDES